MAEITQKDRYLPLAFIIFSLLIFILHFVFFCYSFPETNIDESSFFSPSYSLAEKGVLSTDVHKSFLPGAGNYTYWMPPFYMVVLALLFNIFGSTVYIAKFISLIYVLLAGVILSYTSSNKANKLWIGGLLLVCPFVIICSSVIRMEALGLLVVAAAIYSVKKEAKSGYLGIIAAIAVMTHPLLLACAIALAFVVWRRGIISFAYFGIIAMLALSPYLIYIAHNFDLFKEQMGLQLIRKSQRGLGEIGIMYLIQSLFLAGFTLFLLWKIKKYKELKYFLLVGLSLSCILVLKSGEFNYHVYLVAYTIAALGLYMDEFNRRLIDRFIIPSGLYAFFLLLLIVKVYAGKVKTNEPYKELLAALDKNQKWKGKQIYVYGSPDVSTYLIQNNQEVERQNAVASVVQPGWTYKYNYVICVINNIESKKNTKEIMPWLSWKDKNAYSTKDGRYTLLTYCK